ncbi:hypothetical protein GC207_09240 [bacterium]|nr:hypothetical protein [bacterium]
MTPKNISPPSDRNQVLWLPLDSARLSLLLADHWREIDRQKFGNKVRVELAKGIEQRVEMVAPPRQGAWAGRGRRSQTANTIEPFRVHVALRG